MNATNQGESRDARADDSGTRAASARATIRLAGRILVQSVCDLFTDGGTQAAAAIAYYSLLSVFPLLLAVASISSFFVDPNWVIDEATMRLGTYLPHGHDEIARIVKEVIAARDAAGAFSLVLLVWSGTRVFSAFSLALDVAFGAVETYSSAKRLLVDLMMSLTVGMIFIFALLAQLLTSALGDALGILPYYRGFTRMAIRVLSPAVLLVLSLFLAYRFIPRRRPNWRAASVGATAATLLLLAAQPLFVTYIEHFAQYNLIYGSMAIWISLMLWTWIIALITLFGGELTGHMQRLVIEAQTGAFTKQSTTRDRGRRSRPRRPGRRAA